MVLGSKAAAGAAVTDPPPSRLLLQLRNTFPFCFHFLKGAREIFPKALKKLNESPQAIFFFFFEAAWETESEMKLHNTPH